VSRFALAALAAVLLCACSPSAAIEAVFHRHGPVVVQEATQVAECESGLNPDAVSPGGHLGLFQISMRWHSHRPGMDNPLDALSNSLAAEDIWKEQGWAPWSCAP
jgi:hypothetical protein